MAAIGYNAAPPVAIIKIVAANNRFLDFRVNLKRYFINVTILYLKNGRVSLTFTINICLRNLIAMRPATPQFISWVVSFYPQILSIPIELHAIQLLC
jgi:hypothetical protein